ncbi:hypothetical protein CIHG_06976 [Coccidioides immitis H538.4]|uniref:Uncharacterized protein n=3 Tax=Coccidioides immitis TaxID=5501 RepID=A0A0J8R0J0_COCIT|nr:hypothetical protein CIRG_10021 [Coccidioides immitis RMSCC 2394]KMU77158.1 hypothetical protein CISG_06195 [Coccidioides immitis RMSCC 3703]KMU89304.1 hypothetical protein CIHG_06976 [Coccidioides immitis H538.4]
MSSPASSRLEEGNYKLITWKTNETLQELQIQSKYTLHIITTAFQSWIKFCRWLGPSHTNIPSFHEYAKTPNPAVWREGKMSPSSSVHSGSTLLVPRKKSQGRQTSAPA